MLVLVCDSVDARVLYVWKIDRTTNASSLRALFEPFGGVEKVDVLGRSYAFVHMTSYAEALAAVEGLNGRVDDSGRKMMVSFKQPSVVT